MRLTKRTQLGILLCLYLCRSGRARLKDVAANLDVSESFLAQVANKLVKEGTLASTKGPNGGYELKPDVTVLEVMYGLQGSNFLTGAELNSYKTGTPEKRALAKYSINLIGELNTALHKTITSIMKESISSEVKVLNTLDEKSMEH